VIADAAGTRLGSTNRRASHCFARIVPFIESVESRDRFAYSRDLARGKHRDAGGYQDPTALALFAQAIVQLSDRLDRELALSVCIRVPPHKKEAHAGPQDVIGTPREAATCRRPWARLNRAGSAGAWYTGILLSGRRVR
jgi:hypothetical protein